MKATYQKPTIKTICASLSALMSFSKPEEGFNLGDVPTTNETSNNLSRRHSVWDDDNEEEF